MRSYEYAALINNIKIVKEDPNEKIVKAKLDEPTTEPIQPIEISNDMNKEPSAQKENELVVPVKLKKEKEEKVINVNIEKEKEEKKIHATIPKEEEKIVKANISKNEKDDKVNSLLNKDGNTKEIHVKLNKEDVEAIKNDDENNPLNSDDPKLQIATSMKLLLTSRKGIEKLMAYIPKDDMLIKTKAVIQELLIKLTNDYSIILEDPDKCKEIAKKVYELIISIRIYINEKEEELLAQAHSAEKDSNTTKEIKNKIEEKENQKNDGLNNKNKEKDLKKHLEGELKKAEEAKPETKEKDKNKAKTKEPLKSEKEVISQESLFKDLQLKSAVDAIKVLAIKK